MLIGDNRMVEIEFFCSQRILYQINPEKGDCNNINSLGHAPDAIDGN